MSDLIGFTEFPISPTPYTNYARLPLGINYKSLVEQVTLHTIQGITKLTCFIFKQDLPHRVPAC